MILADYPLAAQAVAGPVLSLLKGPVLSLPKGPVLSLPKHALCYDR